MPANEAVLAMWKPVIIGKINMHVGLYLAVTRSMIVLQATHVSGIDL